MLARVVMTWSCEDLPGFGVEVYSDIDPLARALLTIPSKDIAANPAVAVADSIMKSVRKLTRQHPSYFFAVVYACRAAGLPPQAPLALIAIGRTVGWSAHIIEHTASQAHPACTLHWGSAGMMCINPTTTFVAHGRANLACASRGVPLRQTGPMNDVAALAHARQLNVKWAAADVAQCDAVHQCHNP
jgi:hypothetical protein